MSSNAELTFDFITDDQFRTSLQSDYCEMVKSFEAGAWKAVHVLAGSVIEALLVEYLVVSNIKPKGKDPLTITLSEAIESCQKASVLSSRVASLCDVIKDYRNLIHPGRLIRLQEQYGESSAQISLALVGMITTEVAAKRKEKYGLTAEQIVRKISIDERSLSLVPQLLSETNEYERKRLVERVIADAYRDQVVLLPSETTLKTLRICYKLALLSLSDKEQMRAAARFARLVREESSDKITTYADAFFSCEELQFLGENDRELVKRHFLSRLESLQINGECPSNLVASLEGIGKQLEEKEVRAFTNLCVRFVLSGVEASQTAFSNLLKAEYENLKSAELKSRMEKQIGSWLTVSRERQNYPPEKLKRLEHLANMCSDEIPF